MDDLRKAAVKALEALCSANPIGHALEDYEYHNKATEALRQALAQPEQEPVAAVELITIGSEQIIAVAWHDSNAFKVGIKLYIAPPSKHKEQE